MRAGRLFTTAILGLTCLLAACGGKSYKDPFKERHPVADGEDVVTRDIPPLNAAELQVYLADATLSHQGETRIWHIYLGRDGGLSGLSLSTKGGKERARGTWQVTEDGQLCSQWDGDWGGGETGCAHVYKYRDDYVFVPIGEGPDGDALRRTRRGGDPFKIR